MKITNFAAYQFVKTTFVANVQQPDIHSKQAFWGLLLIMLFALSLRVYHLDKHGIFFDEKATMLISQGITQEGSNQYDVFNANKFTFTNLEFWKNKTIADYYESMRRSDIGNSPFYYLTLHYWTKLTNTSDFYARLLSVIFSVLTIAVLYFFVARFFQSYFLALIASFLTAIEPFFITYSQQARNYSLTFFLTLLASFFFLRALEKSKKKQKVEIWFVLYALTMGLGLLSHFLAATVLLAHGLYLLLFVRDWKSWYKAAVAAIIAIGLLGCWVAFGAGDWTLRTLNYQSAVYLECAINRPYNNPYGTILPATIKNVFVKSLPIFADLWIFTNGLIDSVEGKKNIVLSVFVGLGLIFGYETIRNKHSRVNIFASVALGLLLLSAFIYKNHQLELLALSAGIFMTYLAIRTSLAKTNFDRKYVGFLVILGIVPTAFLMFNAFRSGHTYGLTQRYSGFSFPFVVVLASIALLRLFQINHWLKYVIGIVLGVQIVLVAKTINKVYNDVSLKYNYRTIARVQNPHYAAAKQIELMYQTGDTVLIGSPKTVLDNEMGRTHMNYSVVDAQYVNLYLPKEKLFLQRLDTINVNRISLKKANGQEIVLMDLKTKRY